MAKTVSDAFCGARKCETHMEDKAYKDEDEQHTTGELKVGLAVLLVDIGETSKDVFALAECLGEHHEESTHNGEVAEEEVEVKDEAVAEALNDNDSKKTSDGGFRVAFGNDHAGAGNHGLRHSISSALEVAIPVMRGTDRDVEQKKQLGGAIVEVSMSSEIVLLVTPLGEHAVSPLAGSAPNLR